MKTYKLFERSPIKSSILLTLIGTCLALVLTEGILRLAGFRPKGEFHNIVDQLVVYDKFQTDSAGVFKANPASAAWEGEIEINTSGFRGPEFVPAVPGQKSILILGDSFAWGSGLGAITPFADVLRQAGHRVYNTGILGTGPTQYELLAKAYIPQLNPDYVILSFSMATDLLERPDPNVPDKDLFHVTNAGWLWGFDRDGKPLTAQEAYDYYIEADAKSIDRLIRITSLGTLIRKNVDYVKDAIKSRQLSDTAEASMPHSGKDYSYTFNLLKDVSNLSRENDATFFLLVIPNHGENCSDGRDNVDDFKHVFDELNPIYLDSLPRSTFNPAPDCHVNSEGQRLIAERILSSL